MIKTAAGRKYCKYQYKIDVCVVPGGQQNVKKQVENQLKKRVYFMLNIFILNGQIRREKHKK